MKVAGQGGGDGDFVDRGGSDDGGEGGKEIGVGINVLPWSLVRVIKMAKDSTGKDTEGIFIKKK